METRKIKPPDGGYGWTIVGASVVLNSSLVPIILCFGMIFETKFAEMGISASEISFLLHFNNSLVYILGLFSGPLLKVFNYRNIILFGSFLCCLGIFLTAFANTYGAMIFTICILLGVGNGILMPGTYIAVNTYFKERLTLAISFQVTGTSLVGIFMPQLCNYFLNKYDVERTLLILAAISFHAIPAAMLFRPLTKRKIDVEKFTQEQNAENGVAENLLPVYQSTTLPIETPPRRNIIKSIVKMFNFELLTDKTYLVIAIGMAISFASELNIILMVSFILIELDGFTRSDLAMATSLQSITDVTGRLLVPYLAYKSGLPPKVTYAGALILSSVGRTILASVHNNKPAAFVSMAILGLGKGSKAVFQSIILPKYISFDKLPAANGLLMVMSGLSSLAIGPLIGLTRDIGNSYVYTLYTATCLSLFCVALWIGDYFVPLKNTEEEMKNEVT